MYTVDGAVDVTTMSSLVALRVVLVTACGATGRLVDAGSSHWQLLPVLMLVSHKYTWWVFDKYTRIDYWSLAHLWQDASSQADQWQGSFYLPVLECTSSELTWSRQGTFLRPTVIHCCQGPIHWGTRPSWWLEQSHRLHLWCVQQCLWRAQLQYPLVREV